MNRYREIEVAGLPRDLGRQIGEAAREEIREFCEIAFACADLDYKEFVVQDERYYRPAEVDILQGDYGKAKRVLGWSPRTTFKDLVRVMTEADLELAEREASERSAR